MPESQVRHRRHLRSTSGWPIRSLAAAREDGGVHRADWSAAAFGHIKSVIVTSLKNGLRFINYGLDVVRAKLKGNPLPLPIANPA